MENLDLLPGLGWLGLPMLGTVLGSVGAGGSIFPVPVLVYFLGATPTAATGYLQLIVGTTALLAAVQYLRRGRPNSRMALGCSTAAPLMLFKRDESMVQIVRLSPVTRQDELDIGTELLFAMDGET